VCSVLMCPDLMLQCSMSIGAQFMTAGSANVCLQCSMSIGAQFITAGSANLCLQCTKLPEDPS
jgi:hypothetical protein